MSVSDYSPKRTSSGDRKVTYQVPKKPKGTRKLSKWAQFVESIEIMSREHDVSTESPTPENERKEGFLDFLWRKDAFDRSSPGMSSVRFDSKAAKCQRMTKSLASSPMKAEGKKSPILKCFDMPKLPLGDRRVVKDKTVSPTSLIEDNLMRFMATFPKRRSSTPSTLKTAITQKRISELRESGVKTDSENDDVFLKQFPKRKRLKDDVVLCDTPENIIITKTAPSIERFRKYSSTSSDGEIVEARRLVFLL